jgi:antitoxin component YwqK of YwqJK toxin-antitoxin module
MRKIFYLQLILLGFVIFPVIGQENINSNGFNTFYYPNGKVLSEGYMKDGKPEGYWKTYYTTGIIKSEGNRRNFQLDSIWIFYNSTGDTITKINYLYGRKNGYYYEYYTDRSKPEYIGKVKSKELYVNDVKEGVSYYYYEDGRLHETITYKDDLMSGESIEYDVTGRVITIKRYNKGSLVERQKINRFDENNEKTGEWIEFYTGLKIKSISNYKNGLLDGYYKEYNQLGKLTLTLLYNEGKLVERVDEKNAEIKVVEKRDSEGNIIESGPFMDGTPVGIHKTFDNAGNITGSMIYDDLGNIVSNGIIDREGNKQGEWKDFFNTGKRKKDEGAYKNNLRDGKWIFYFENGNTEQIGSYKNGKENGEWIRYFESGKTYVDENFYSGKEDGMYTEYDSLGNVITQGEFLEGEKEGDWIVKINDFMAKGKYVAGLLDGKWKYFYDDGTLMFEGNYIQGNADGKHRYYYPDGSLKEERIYASGIPDKIWKKYDPEGNLIVTITYQDGKEYRINGVRIDFPEENKVVIK